MFRSVLLTACLLIAAMDVFAQENAKDRLGLITTEVRHAGVYHVQTGTWTRGASLANLIGPDVVYNNTCTTNYFFPRFDCERVQHRSRIPSPTGPTTPTAVPGQTGNDEAPGCRASYLVNGFQFAYCSSAATSVDWELQFANFYGECALADMVADHTFDLTGMPGGTSGGTQRCWTIDVDLGSPPTGQAFTAQADGDGAYNGPSTSEQFGWSWQKMYPPGFSDLTGAIVAGNYTSGGGPVSGKLTACKGTDGTIWDCPVDLTEEGTGMSSNDFFRVDSMACLHGGGGCYYLGGNLHADFHLKLYADVGCQPNSPFTSFCHPGDNGVIACPCGNPPFASGRGCENSSFTGGAVLSACGRASLAGDSVVFTTLDERPTALSIVLQGTTPIPAGVAYGQGVRCVGGSLKRLFTKSAVGGSIIAPEPGDPSVSARSTEKGDPIPPGGTRHYLVYYRDPNVLGGCPGTSTFNGTQSGSISWGP